jgi:predicted dinucleotide-utilizing enzyme
MKKRNINISIIGLGRIGSAFFDAIRQRQSLNLVCVAELADTPTKSKAAAAGIRIATLDEIVAMGNAIDVIFELTGMPEVRKELREKLHDMRNYHTVVASETIARLIWPLIDAADQ